MVAVLKKTNDFDLSEFRRFYPATVASLGALPNREAWLRRICELDARWQKSREQNAPAAEVLTTEQPTVNIQGIANTFDIVYAGGGLGLLHAAVMSKIYERRVLVFDAHTVGQTHRDWNVSDDELKEFVRAKLFTPEEIEIAVLNRYRSGFVKFYDRNSRVKAAPLWMDNVLDVALEANCLLELAAAKIRQSKTDSVLLDGMRFVRAYNQADRVLIETENVKTGQKQFFAARLFVDATGTNSPVSRQLNDGRSITHVCPTVGTVARGFVRGDEPDEVDFNVGEILVSTEDAADHRQLIWEGFAGSSARDEYTTYLFFYDAVDSPADKSLPALFERYFEKISTYKRRGTNWRVVKPVFGYIPSVHHRGWRNQKQTAANRTLLIGDSAGLSSPLTFCGFGSHVRNLRRLTHLTELRLKADALDKNSLAEINAYEPRVAQMSSLAEFMRPTPAGKSSAVNETMNAVMQALHDLAPNIRRELFQDTVKFASFSQVLKRTAQIHPLVFKRMLEHLGVKNSFWWIANIAQAALHERRGGKLKNRRLEDMDDAEFARQLEFYQHHLDGKSKA